METSIVGLVFGYCKVVYTSILYYNDTKILHFFVLTLTAHFKARIFNKM